jgi:hypothetical protein
MESIYLPSGKVYQNFCLGCDKFHEEVLLRLSPDSKRTADLS